MFNENFSTNDYIGRVLGPIQSTMIARFSHGDQRNLGHRFLVGDEIKKRVTVLSF